MLAFKHLMIGGSKTFEGFSISYSIFAVNFVVSEFGCHATCVTTVEICATLVSGPAKVALSARATI